jgi:hypothetical protein
VAVDEEVEDDFEEEDNMLAEARTRSGRTSRIP